MRRYHGTVENQVGHPMSQVLLTLAKGGDAAYSDDSGAFRFEIPAGTQDTLRIRHPGFLPLDMPLMAEAGSADSSTGLSLVLEAEALANKAAEALELKTIRVVRKSKANQLEEGAFSVSVVDTRRQAHRSKNNLDLLNAEAGLTVRRDGGMGSRTDVLVHGLSGRRVRFFVDGIPTDFLGMGSLAIPVNLLDRVEIYKGAVPIELGGDALGGAVNLVTRKDAEGYFDFSYGYGSFDSHVTSLQTRMTLPAGCFVEARAYQNLSDNDYPVDVYLQDPVTLRQDSHSTSVRRFHDGFSNGGWRAMAGRRAAEDGGYAALGIEGNALTKEIQHNINMEQPYGEVLLREKTGGAFLDYADSALAGALDLRLHGSLRRTETGYRDTSRNTYDWTGAVIRRRNSGGEVAFDRSNHIRLETDVALGSASLAWRIGRGWKAGLNNLVVQRGRTGEDLLRVDDSEEDALAKPNTLFRNEAGAAVEGSFGNGAVSITTAKLHSYRARGYTREMDLVEREVSESAVGFGQAFRMDLGKALVAKASYERTSRLPDESELFGYLREVQSNMALHPEKGHNLNLGLRLNQGPITAEIGGFYRLVDDLIYLRVGSFWAQHQNLLKARYAGGEGSIRWRPARGLDLELNGTYQDIRNLSEKGKSGSVDDRYYAARIPNLPYLFGNAAVTVSRIPFLLSHDRLRIFWNARYIHEFYLYWAVDGRKDTKAVIPSQLTQDAGLTYGLFHNSVNLTVEALNLADTQVFDHFKIQRPGRSLHAKISVFFDRGIPSLSSTPERK
jgi:outer membrane receptor protein involved in Fe transport